MRYPSPTLGSLPLPISLRTSRAGELGGLRFFFGTHARQTRWKLSRPRRAGGPVPVVGARRPAARRSGCRGQAWPHGAGILPQPARLAEEAARGGEPHSQAVLAGGDDAARVLPHSRRWRRSPIGPAAAAAPVRRDAGGRRAAHAAPVLWKHQPRWRLGRCTQPANARSPQP